MRINIIQGAFLPVPPTRGGAVEKMWHLLGQEFARLGHTVTHVSRSVAELPAKGTSNQVHHVRVPGYDQPANGIWLKFLDLLYTRRACAAAPAADVTVTNTFWAPLLSRSRHGQVVVDVARMPKGQLRLYDRAALLRANSTAVRNAMIAERPKARERIRVVPNPLTTFPQKPDPWLRRPKTLLYAGRLHPEKGLELLLAAWRKLDAEPALKDWKLHIVGPVDSTGGGGGADWWRSALARHGQNRVHTFPPVYDEARLIEHYASARLFVYPSVAETGETFGSAVLEAMSHGTPPVVSELECFKDFVRPGHNGIAFNHRGPGAVDHLATTLKEAMLSDQSATSIEAQLVKYTHAPAVIAQSFLNVFDSIVPPGE